MANATQLIQSISSGAYDAALANLYGGQSVAFQKQRYTAAVRSFGERYGADREIELFSAPGRSEIGGNHNDHQRGRVVAAGVNLDIICVVSPSGNHTVRIQSEGYPEDVVELDSLEKRENEENKAISLIRGMLCRFQELGHRVGGFDAYTTSNVLKGSGLSSSAAFEVAVGTIVNHLYNDGTVSAVEIAQIGQYAENVFFGKPSGLLDQTASAVAGFVAIDFQDPEHPVVEPIDFDLSQSGYSLCIVDTKGSHADLTGEYAAIPQEMGRVSRMFGKEYLREVDEEQFFSRLAEVRENCGDRATLRAIHFFGENKRALQQAEALRRGDFQSFLKLVVDSGRSSFCYLQNVFATIHPQEQGVSLGLALSERILDGRGAWRIQGGGFAGTIQAFVPADLLETYREQTQALFGEGSCYVLNVRAAGGVKVCAQ